MHPVPVIDDNVARMAPDFRAISLFVSARGADMTPDDGAALPEACRRVLAGGPIWAEAHLASWAETYERFGAKPARTPCSAQALRKRVLKNGSLPGVNPVVDLYNAVSLRYAVPVGGENLDAYAGPPRLTVADGSEPFDTVANGAPVIENPAAGEIVWRDDEGVTCRRWNWRQGSRTRLDSLSGRMWFVLESLGTMPQDALEEAADLLADGLHRLLPGCDIQRHGLMASPPS